MKMSKNKLLLFAFLAAIGGLFYWGMRPQPIAVDLATIDKGDLSVTIDEEGVTRIREIYAVSAPVSGVLRRLSLSEGDRVKAHKTIVAVIEPIAPTFQDTRSMTILRARVKSAEAALILARAELSRVEADEDYAKSDFERTNKLYKKRITSRKSYDQALNSLRRAKAAVTSAKANVEVSKKELESAKANLIQPSGNNNRKKSNACCLSITAPASGRVLSLKHKSEMVVSAGTPLLEIGDDRKLEITVDLLSEDAVKVALGAPVLIDNWGGPNPLHATVRRIEPAGFTKVSALGIEEQRVKLILDLKDIPPHSAHLGHDFRVFSRIEIWKGGDILLAPLSALFRKGSDWAVYVAKGGRARLKKIQIDHRTSHYAQVVKGLSKGDQVIVHPSDQISDGSMIIERED